MKKLVIASALVGAAIAGLFFYLRNQYTETKTANDVADAADDTLKAANQFIKNEERAFDPALN